MSKFMAFLEGKKQNRTRNSETFGSGIGIGLRIGIVGIAAGVFRLVRSVLVGLLVLFVLAGDAPLGDGGWDGQPDVGATLVQFGVGAVLVLAVLHILGLPALVIGGAAKTRKKKGFRSVAGGAVRGIQV